MKSTKRFLWDMHVINKYPIIASLSLTFIGLCIANIFGEYNQQDATLHYLFISVRHSACFRRFFHPSSGAQNHIQRHVLVWQIPDAVCTVLSSWWWTKKPSETCRASTEIHKLWNIASCWLYSANASLSLQTTNLIQHLLTFS